MISEKYKQQLESMQKVKAFSEKNKNFPLIKKFIEDNNPSSVLDFGCAGGGLIEKLRLDFPNIIFDGYDPGVEKFSKIPNKNYDCVISNDVIEHIEPKYLNETLALIDGLFTKQAWLIIACYPAMKKLPDGRNAHLTVQTPDWWIDKIQLTMPSSKIIWHHKFIKNPDSDVRSKKSNRIVIPKGEQQEIRLILSKNG